MSLQRAQSQKDGAPAWLPGGPDRPINLAVFGSRTFFWFVGFCGCLLLSLGVGLHYGTDSGPEVDWSRWIVFFACICLATVTSVVIVEVLCPLIEVRHFLALASLPSSWALYKFFLLIVSVYCSFESLWRWSAWGMAPDEDMSTPAIWVERVLLCVLVFTCVTMALVILAKILVSQLYGIKHTHKVLIALHQESILADLAACIAPSVAKPQDEPPPAPPPPPAPEQPIPAQLPTIVETNIQPPVTATVTVTSPGQSSIVTSVLSPTQSVSPSEATSVITNPIGARVITRPPTGLHDSAATAALEASRGPETSRRPKLTSVFREALEEEKQHRAAAAEAEAMPRLGLPRAQGRGASSAADTAAAAAAALATPTGRSRRFNNTGGYSLNPRQQLSVPTLTLPPTLSEPQAAAPGRQLRQQGSVGPVPGFSSAPPRTMQARPSIRASIRGSPSGQVAEPLTAHAEEPESEHPDTENDTNKSDNNDNSARNDDKTPQTTVQASDVSELATFANPGSPPTSVAGGVVGGMVGDAHVTVILPSQASAGSATDAAAGAVPPVAHTAVDIHTVSPKASAAPTTAPATSPTAALATAPATGSPKSSGRGIGQPPALPGVDISTSPWFNAGAYPVAAVTSPAAAATGAVGGAATAAIPAQNGQSLSAVQLLQGPVSSDVPPAQGAVPPGKADKSFDTVVQGEACSTADYEPPPGPCGRLADWFAQQAYHFVAWLATVVLEARDLISKVTLQDEGTVHIRQTLVQALYLVHQLSDKNHNQDDAVEMAAAALRAAHESMANMDAWAGSARPGQGAVRDAKSSPVFSKSKTIGQSNNGFKPGMEVEDMTSGHWRHTRVSKQQTWLRFTSPRRLLDSLLDIYAGLTDEELANMANTYSKLVFASIQPSNPDYISRSDLINIGIDPEGVEMVWELFDKNDNDEMTPDEIKATAITFYQQRRNLALTVRAMRNLTLSIMVGITLLINCVFLMVVYLSILQITNLFGANKTSLDFFSAYILVVSLMFGEQIRGLLVGAVFLLTQQPFDIGESIIVEEGPNWRYGGAIQDFNLVYIRLKKGGDGEMVTLPISKIANNKFVNVTRSDWKIEQNYFTVDIDTPRDVLQRLTDKALAHINAHPTEYDTDFGFAAFYHGLEKPNKLIIRTMHRYHFNLDADAKRSGRARDGVIHAVCSTFLEMKISFSEIRLNAQYVGPNTQEIPSASSALPREPLTRAESSFAVLST